MKERNRNRDLRIPNATPEAVGRVLMRGGAAPRPETRRGREPSPGREHNLAKVGSV
jgi:hypothetical protein